MSRGRRKSEEGLAVLFITVLVAVVVLTMVELGIYDDFRERAKEAPVVTVGK